MELLHECVEVCKTHAYIPCDDKCHVELHKGSYGMRTPNENVIKDTVLFVLNICAVYII